MEEKRNLKRIHRNLDVIEQTSGDLIGYTGNVHHEGMMLVSQFQPALFLDIPIWIDVPEINEKIPLVINGKWSQTNKNSDLYGTGCQLVESSPETICNIKELVSEDCDDMLMKYNIPQCILDETECPTEFSCLYDGKCKGFPRCDADYTASEYLTFLKPGVTKEVLHKCKYVFASYNKMICKCPVRYYLKKENGV